MVIHLHKPSHDDADLQAFTKPLLGKQGASLRISHARYEKDDGQTKTGVEYNFAEAELNRASINIDRQILLPPPIEAEKYLEGAGAFHTGSCCFWSKQTGGRGRKRGELVTKCHIPDVSDKVVPVYFRRRIQGLKARMMHGQENPFERVIVVTVQATALDGAVQADTATEIHDRFPRPE